MGQVLAVISGKGGTGKTSVCAGVAGCLCLEGARVLCIDADLGLRNLDISLGMASEASVSFLEVMRGDYTLEQAPRAAGLSGLQLLTAPVSVCAEDLDGAQFASLIDEARRRYDWVLLDAPAGIGAGFDLAVRHADELMVVCLADPASQRDAARAAELALTKREVPAKLVVNRVSPQLFRRMNATVDDHGRRGAAAAGHCSGRRECDACGGRGKTALPVYLSGREPCVPAHCKKAAGKAREADENPADTFRHVNKGVESYEYHTHGA